MVEIPVVDDHSTSKINLETVRKEVLRHADGASKLAGKSS